MSNPIYIVVVLYNKLISDIVSLDNFMFLRKTYNVKIIVCDNSNEEYRLKNSELSGTEKYQKIIYIDNGGNIGLSQSYNKAIQRIQENPYWMMLADDDTFFSEDYLNNVCEGAQSVSQRLITGIIYTDQAVFSPALNYSPIRQRMKFIDSTGIYKNIYAVNSGLTIHSSVFEKIGLFDERLFLDMVDYHFMEQLIKNGMNEVRVVDGEINQLFSGESSGGWEKDIYRFKILKKDIKNFYKINKKNQIVMYLTLLKRYLHIILLNIKDKS